MADLWIQKQLANQNKILTEPELAEALGISKWTARGMRIKEGCPHFTIGHRIFYSLGTVLSWINTKEQASVTKTAPPAYGTLRQIR